MMKRESKLTGLLAMTVFALFSVCVLLVLLTGVRTYRNLVRRGEEGYTLRTAAGYLTTRVRQAEGLRTEPFGDTRALVLEETLEGETYLTRVYCHEGWLRELYTGAEGAFRPEEGEPVLRAEELRPELREDLLRLKLRLPDGEELTLFLQISTEQEVSSWAEEHP